MESRVNNQKQQNDRTVINATKFFKKKQEIKMNIFNTALDAVKNHSSDLAESGGNNQSPMEIILGLINDPQMGGISGLIEKFTESGLGAQVTSWIGTGENLPITAEHIQAALGSSFIQDIASKFGVNTTDLSSSLASLIPQVVDKLTPDGQIPSDNNLLQKGLSGISSLFGNKTA